MLRFFTIISKIFLIFISAIITNFAIAQKTVSVSKFKASENDLRTLLVKIAASKNDEDRVSLNADFTSKFQKILKEIGSFSYSFDSLKFVTQLVSPKGDFKLFTWNIPLNNGTYQYFGFIQKEPSKNNISQLFKLTDKSDSIVNPIFAICSSSKW